MWLGVTQLADGPWWCGGRSEPRGQPHLVVRVGTPGRWGHRAELRVALAAGRVRRSFGGHRHAISA